eukprot:1554741-Amphidinium_carterae.1
MDIRNFISKTTTAAENRANARAEQDRIQSRAEQLSLHFPRVAKRKAGKHSRASLYTEALYRFITTTEALDDIACT